MNDGDQDLKIGSRCGDNVALLVGANLALGIGVAAFVLIGRIPSPPKKPVADIFQKGSGGHRSVVLAIDPHHAFPDGRVQEGWLLRDRWGTETWFPRENLPRAELMLRTQSSLDR